MQIRHQFINSMIRSGVSAKEKEETNHLLGILVEKAFTIGKETTVTDYVNLMCDLVADPKYSDNMAYVLAFSLKYSHMNPDFLKAMKEIMVNFHAQNMVKVIDMMEDMITSKKLSTIIDLSNFLILHVNGVVVKQVQGLCRKKYNLDLSADQVRGLLKVVCMTKEMLKTMELEMDGSDIVIEDLEVEDKTEFTLPEHMNIVVLAGGLSNERNLSLKSGYVVSGVLKEKGHNVILLDAFMGYGEKEVIIDNAFKNPDKYSMTLNDIPTDIPDLWAVRKRRKDESNAYCGPHVLQICKQADLVPLALHGANGENGKVQAAFDLLGIDYTGCDYFSSAISSNKTVSKELLAENGIDVPRGYLIVRDGTKYKPENFGMGYPVIVKPNNGGIGLGISVANDENAYNKAIKEAFRWENEIIVEEYIFGREFAVGCINGMALPVIEVTPLRTADDSFGININGERTRKCPAELDKYIALDLQATAEKVASVLGVTACAKVDFILRNDGSYVCLECDSLPQLYQDAHIVTEAAAAGISFSELCDRIMTMSLKK